MNGELVDRALNIQKEFTQSFTFDIHDLSRPSAEAVLRDLVRKSNPQWIKRLECEFFGYGPLPSLVNDPEVLEIIVNGQNEIWFEKSGSFHRHRDHFLTEATFRNFTERLCAESSSILDLARPFADGRWRDFRVHLACAPLTHCNFHVTLRRIPENPWTLERLLELNWATPDQMATLKEQIHQRKNVIVIGPTGCGKTSVLSACLKSLPEDERVVIVEDTDELPRPNTASTKMLTRPWSAAGLSEVTLTDLVKQSLRMRPMRIAVGEVRGAEAKDLLLALATGHSGSLGTLHASDPRQALLRLEMLVQMGAPQWNQQAIRQLMHLSLDTIVLCGNRSGHRCLEGIFKVAALESIGFLLEQLA